MTTMEYTQHGRSELTLDVREHETNVVVSTREMGADGVVVLTLTDVDGHPLPTWTPGAHIDLVLSDDLTRQYSLCGNPADNHSWRIGVLREPESRGGSVFVHDQLQEGATARVRGPRNHFKLVPSPNYLFIAGGIGITPILTMAAAAEAAGANWRLIYGGRQASSMAFIDELRGYGDKVSVWPQEEKGFIDLPGLLDTPQADTAVYCCGPGPLLDAVEQRCEPWPKGSLHIERFVAKPLTAPVLAESFEVELVRSGLTLEVVPDKSILETIQDAGIPVLSSCAEGTCGTCETTVLEGDVDHRDSVLTEEEREENTCMMICVSRAKCARLVLDI